MINWIRPSNAGRTARRVWSAAPPNRTVESICRRAGRITRWALLATLVAFHVPISHSANHSAPIVILKPGDNIGEIVSAQPAGTVFHFQAGIYRQQTVEPKDRQKFIGRPGAILNGAMLVSGWRRQDSLWAAQGPAQRLRLTGFCQRSAGLCKHREDLFVDGKLYRRVGSLGEVAAGSWHDNGVTLFLADNPEGKTIELGVTAAAFTGRAQDVRLENLTVEKYASRSQRGAIEILRTRGWRLKNMTVRWNHGVGVRMGPETQLIGGSYSNNGQLGVGGGYGGGIVLDGVEIAYNNYADYSWRWEAGGTKFFSTEGLIVRNSCVHHNHGPGLWSDNDNINVLYINNKVFENTGEGIKHEISYKAVIRDNIVARNGSSHDNWLWGGQILVQNSRDVQIFGNTVEVAHDFGNGLTILHQRRGGGRYGPYISWNNTFRDNVVIHLGRSGKNGMAADFDKERFFKSSNNRFFGNTYIVPRGKRNFIVIHNRVQSWETVKELGFENTGMRHFERRSPLQLTCDRRAVN